MSKTTETATMRANGNVAFEWIGDRLRATTRQIGSRPADTIWFNPALVSMKNRHYAMCQGFADRIRDCFAVDTDKFPTKEGRIAEGVRRATAVIKHLESGVETWNLASDGVAKGFDIGLALDAMLRYVRGERGDEVTMETVESILATTVAKRGLPDREAAIRHWAASRQVASIMLEIEHERKVAAAANRPDDAGDLLDEMFQAP